MSWRVVVISNRCKLDYKTGHMVVRSSEDEKRIFLGDISTIICETTAVSITAYLLAELVKSKIKIVFCDNLHNPISELMPTKGSYDSSGIIRKQIHWSAETKAKIWQHIVETKIRNQASVLAYIDEDEKAKQLREYANEVQLNDSTNREGHAAKVYFNTIFDEDFYRKGDGVKNAILDYGYTVLLSCFNREIVASGYLTQLGIWHDNASNPFNLSSDLMESFRPIIDKFAHDNGSEVFETEEKHAVVALLNSQVGIAESKQYLNNAIGMYVRSVFTAIEKDDVSEIKDWYEL